MREIKAFTNHKYNGVLLKFSNGNELSTIWGAGSYSDNYDGDIRSDYEDKKDFETRLKEGSETCEVLPTCSNLVKKLLDATFPDEENGCIFGRMSIDKWIKMINILNENK